LAWPGLFPSLFVSLKRKERKCLGKKKEVSGSDRGHWKEGLWRLIFLQNVKPSSIGGAKKLY